LARNITGNQIYSNIKGIYVNTITKNGSADEQGSAEALLMYTEKHGGDLIVAIDGHPC